MSPALGGECKRMEPSGLSSVRMPDNMIYMVSFSVARIKLHSMNGEETPLVVRFVQIRSTWGINEPVAKTNKTLRSSNRSANRSVDGLFKHRTIRTLEAR